MNFLRTMNAEGRLFVEIAVTSALFIFFLCAGYLVPTLKQKRAAVLLARLLILALLAFFYAASVMV